MDQALWQHIILIAFLLALGASIGSFLNVVVWRLPRGKSLLRPASHCPKCNTPLAWYDNIPVLGWILLRGRCRYCHEPISAQYPIIEALTALLFVLYYVMFFLVGIGPCAYPGTAGPRGWPYSPLAIHIDWPIYALYMFLLACLLVASLVDAELYIIPVEMMWLAAAVGIIVHAGFDAPGRAGALNAAPVPAAMAAGAALGLLLSNLAHRLGWVRLSFAEGEPILEVDRESVQREIDQARRRGEQPPPMPPVYTSAQIRAEMKHEMLFLLFPMVLSVACAASVMFLPPLRTWWASAIGHQWLSGMLGAVLGALVAGFIIWLTRILGTLVFGRVAMGLGDVHLMFGIGAVVGAGASVVVFFLAPFFGIAAAGVIWLIRRRGGELPFGPHLAMATAAVMLVYCPIAAHLAPGLIALGQMLRELVAS